MLLGLVFVASNVKPAQANGFFLSKLVSILVEIGAESLYFQKY